LPPLQERGIKEIILYLKINGVFPFLGTKKSDFGPSSLSYTLMSYNLATRYSLRKKGKIVLGKKKKEKGGE
jgi:hypothetical protein